MIVKRIGPISIAKVSGALYALMGLVIGAIMSAISVVGGAIGGSDAGMMGMIFGAAAVILMPLLYGCVGFVTTLIGAGLFNLAAGWVGGVELETQ